jgi:hypothetical protein
LDLRFVFLLENAWTDSTSSWTGGALGPPWTRAIAALGASPELGLLSLQGSRPLAKGAGRWRRGRGTVCQPHLAPASGEEAARRRGVVAVGARRWGHASIVSYFFLYETRIHAITETPTLRGST